MTLPSVILSRVSQFSMLPVRFSVPGWIRSALWLRNCMRVPWHCQDQQKNALTEVMVRLMDTSITLMSMALDSITMHALVRTRWFPTSLLWRGIEIRTLIMQGLWYGYDPPHPYLSPHPLELTLWLYWNSFTSQSWFPSGRTGQQRIRSYILKYFSQYPNPSSNSPECVL